MAIFYTGNTGRSTGPHLDFRVWSHDQGRYIDPTAFTGYIKSGDGGLEQFTLTSPYGADRGSYIHQGIDYATELGTPITVEGGRYLTTFNDKGGGITSQYEIEHDGGKYDILLMHGDPNKNTVLSSAAVTDGVSLAKLDGSTPTPSETPAPSSSATPEEKAQDLLKSYVDMTKAEMNAAYDKMRKEDPVKAAAEGMKMHKAFFGKA